MKLDAHTIAQSSAFMTQYGPSRRAVLLGLAACSALRPTSSSARSLCDEPASDNGPTFSPTGPRAEAFGIREGFPVADPLLRGQPGEPLDMKYRVGAFSHFDDQYRTRRVARAAAPWCFAYAITDVRYRYKGADQTIEDYLARHPVTGLLIAKDQTILQERYQYGRSDRDRLFSGSMAKSITGLLVGLAVADGSIRSADDAVQGYVPELQGTEYGKTALRDLLHMSSGVKFGEEANGDRDLDRLWGGMVLGHRSWIDRLLGRGAPQRSTIDTISAFTQRIAPAGTEFHYSSMEPAVLGLVVERATGRTLSDYLHEKVWSQIGTEADGAWLVNAQGSEVAWTFFGAALRDYARLGRLLAHDGKWEGRQIIPAQWMIEATTARPSDRYLSPGVSGPQALGYGYLMWLLPGSGRQFVLLGGYGHRIFIDPTAKLIMVQTGVDSSIDQSDEPGRLWAAVVSKFGR
ncbi:beta-lactamase family protein [Variovorax paradoxus]|uniref:serine hydrolase domain-containing protein n=2 Tax=Variovorax TaxID=34072 RepID=UPI0021ACE4AC|nr:serine hydrolase [Variovorax paradoxus]UVH56991.1 beta-lactamase family protein [Variovorax paradoxus]